MKNIVVKDGKDRWEFIHTPDLGRASSVRLRAYVGPDMSPEWGGSVDRWWSLTAEARLSATMSNIDAERKESKEETNNMERPVVPEHVVEEACRRAGAGGMKWLPSAPLEPTRSSRPTRSTTCPLRPAFAGRNRSGRIP